MPAVDPRQRHRRAGEVEEHVEQAEERRCIGHRLERLLHAALDVDAERPLDLDDVRRVAHRGLHVLAACTTHDLVEAVEHGEAGDLAGAGM